MLSGFFQNFRKPRANWLGRAVVRNMNSGHAALTAWGLSHVTMPQGGRVLDIGCGGGGAIARMLARYPESRVDGVDYSDQSVAVSRETNKDALRTRCAITQGSVSQLPFASGQYDLVTAFETVYFWPDLPGDFREVARVLAPGGQFLLCVEFDDPSNDTWTKRIEGMRVYSAETLSSLLTGAGFSDIRIAKEKKTHLCIVATKA